MTLKDVIRKHVLKNAFDYGKASAGNVVGKVIAEFPDAKNDMKKTMQEINAAIAEVNNLSKQEIEEKLKDFEFVKKEEKEKKWVLPGVENGVVTRFPPEPNGYSHIGHAKAAFLNIELARQYDGKCFLRWDDTNPEAEKKEFVDAIRQGLEWVGASFAGESYASDDMPAYYEYAGRLVSQGDAYVCFCKKEDIADNRMKKKPCQCRSASKKENQGNWHEMKTGMEEGKAVLRLKADLSADNTVMRDPTLYRIILTPHYKQGTKYRAWPTYDFEVSIADSLSGVTHTLRSKEYELRDELYYYILDKLKLRKPVLYDFSRLNLQGTMMSKRFIKPLIEEKKVDGWDDPRLPTLFGLRRRGIQPEAIKKFVLSFGLSKVESNPSWDALFSENKKIVEEKAEHFFAVVEPVVLRVEKAPEKMIQIPFRHSKKMRVLEFAREVYLAREDVEKLSTGEVIRLKDCFNVKITSTVPLKGEFAGDGLVEKKLQWVPMQDAWPFQLVKLGELLVDGKFNEDSWTEVNAVGEPALKNAKKGEVVQLERIGFATNDGGKFLLTH